MSLRILAIGHDAGIQGAPRVMLNMLEWFRENSDLQFEVILHMGGPLLRGFQGAAPTSVLNPFLGSPRFSARMSRLLIHNPQTLDRVLAMRLHRRIHNPRCDVIWMNSVASWKAVDAVAPLGVPRVLHVHELANIIRQVGPPKQAIVEMAERFVAASGAVREHLVNQHGVDRHRITVAYSTVAPRQPQLPDPRVRLLQRSRMGIGRDDVVLVACGVGSSAKGLDLVGQLLSKLRCRGDLPPVRLVWVGRVEPNVSASLQIDLDRLGVAEDLHLPGEVEDPRQFFSLADIFVLPSREEAFPLVVLEAAQCRLPTVCFADAGGAPEFVEDDSGRVVPYLDLDTFAAAVAELTLDQQLRTKLGDRAHQKVEARFTTQCQAPRLLEAFRKVTQRAR